MSKEMEFLGKQSFELSRVYGSNQESRIGWSAIVTGWLHRWKAREQGTVYASYAEVLRQEIEIINAKRELMLEQDESYQGAKSELARWGIIREIMKVKDEIATSTVHQQRMTNEHDALVDQSKLDKEERRRKTLNPNQLLQDDLRILNRQILDLDKDDGLDQESRKELLEILLMQKRRLLEAAKGSI